MVFVLASVLLCGFLVGVADSDENKSIIQLGFPDRNTFNHWEKVTFPDKKRTEYRYDRETNTVCGKAENSASALAREYPVSVASYPVIQWEWKIDSVLENGNARRKEQDDYAARLYVNFERDGRLSWWERAKLSVFETFSGQEVPSRSINFIWANQLRKGEIVPSPYTEHARLFAFRSGNQYQGQWMQETVDITKAFQKGFDEELPPVQSVAIMVDADNTGGEARGCFRRIRLMKNRSRKEK